MNKRENIYSLQGFGKVFKFTLKQTFKNKGYILSFVIFVLTMSLMGPIQYLSQKSGENAARNSVEFNGTDVETEKLYIYNDTSVDIDIDDISPLYTGSDGSENQSGLIKENIYINKIDGNDITSENQVMEEISSKDSAVIIQTGEKGIEVKGLVTKDSEVKAGEIDEITSIILDAYDYKRMESSGLSDEDVNMIFSGVNSYGVTSQNEYLSEEAKTVSARDYMFYNLGFTIIIFIVITLSNSYIITSVTEEKTSKLVESLLVSVRPMALLMGKVLGMMSYVVLLLVCGIIGTNISSFVMKNVFSIEQSEFNTSGFDFSIFKDFGPGVTLSLVFSIILAFLFFGTLGGLMGSACNKTEDIQTATGNLMTISMIGYMGSIFIGSADKDIITKIGSILPPFSFYMSPVSFAAGRIGLVELIVSYLIQIILVVLAMMLSAKTYRNLVLSDSSTPKLMAILKSAKN
ncbi:MAG: ABC transporter permease [Eubacterium sp.]|nr:ABC transporter permease [Eubacterium sp.]